MSKNYWWWGEGRSISFYLINEKECQPSVLYVFLITFALFKMYLLVCVYLI